VRCSKSWCCQKKTSRGDQGREFHVANVKVEYFWIEEWLSLVQLVLEMLSRGFTITYNLLKSSHICFVFALKTGTRYPQFAVIVLAINMPEKNNKLLFSAFSRQIWSDWSIHVRLTHLALCRDCRSKTQPFPHWVELEARRRHKSYYWNCAVQISS